MTHFGLDDRGAKRLVDRKLVTVDGVVVYIKSAVVSGLVTTTIFEADSRNDPVFVHERFALFDKPSGLVMYPSKARNDRSLLDDVHKHFGNLATHTHRLDKETSGLVLVARDLEADRLIKGLFRDKEVYKTYLAFVVGHLTERHEVHAKLIEQNGIDEFDSAVSDEGKEATTIIEPLESHPDLNATLVRCTPLTGRTHQIRIHCFHIGHKIIGEPVYGIDPALRKKYLEREMEEVERVKVTGARRLMLHAYRIKFSFGGSDFEITSKMEFGTKEFLQEMMRPSSSSSSSSSSLQ